MNSVDLIKKGVEYIKSQQQKDGSFLSLTSVDPTFSTKSTKCQTVFTTALVLSCLNSIETQNDVTLNKIKKDASGFLLTQKGEHWTFNYWTRGSKQSKVMPYPDDLDDTACALAALSGYDQTLIDGEVLASVVTILAALETKEGGPYRTWLVPPSAQAEWLDIDLAVNSNIGYLLQLQGVKLKNIEKLIEAAIDENHYISPYYSSEYSVIYFISRFYKGKKKGKIIDFLLRKKRNNNWGNPLDTALAVSALANFGVDKSRMEKSVEYILRKRKRNGSWGAEPLYFDANSKKHKNKDVKKYYSGSSALTTAFCLEAISKVFSREPLEQKQGLKQSKNNREDDAIYESVEQRARKYFGSLGVDLKKQANEYLKKTTKGDKNKEIVLLAHFFASSFNQKLSIKQKSIITDFGLANLYGWMAYTIYDDFLDDEGNPEMLSIANVSLREAYHIFSRATQSTEYAGFVTTVFNRIDSVNAWELAHCRVKDKTLKSALAHPVPDFSDITNLADRSLGHALGPIGIMCTLGYNVDSKESINVLEGFRHYIAAKQILDDMHDWEEDLLRGQINSASAALISSIQSLKQSSQSDVSDLSFLQQKFWNEIAVVLCAQASAHLEQARCLFSSAGLSQTFVNYILNALHHSTEQTLKERSDAKKFIDAYTKEK